MERQGRFTLLAIVLVKNFLELMTIYLLGTTLDAMNSFKKTTCGPC
jgi:hypothetical protein